MNSMSQVFKETLLQASRELESASQRIEDSQLEKLVSIYDFLISTGGSLFFSGIGKSGQVGKKISSTFCSLGLRSYFLGPVDALHGDLGRVSKGDAIVLISKSGTTEELLKLCPYLDIPVDMRIGLLGNPESPLAAQCGLTFDCHVEKEACLNNQAPTTSTTVAMAVGDAMAIVYQNYTGLSKEGFASNHPGGLLGKSLRLKVKDLMVPESECARLSQGMTLKDAVVEMTKWPTGLCAVVDKDKKLLGIIVEGDIRRSLMDDGPNLERKVDEIMNPSPVFAAPEDLAYEALKSMEKRKRQISTLPVVKDGAFVGAIRLHDLLKEGLI